MEHETINQELQDAHDSLDALGVPKQRNGQDLNLPSRVKVLMAMLMELGVRLNSIQSQLQTMDARQSEVTMKLLEVLENATAKNSP